MCKVSIIMPVYNKEKYVARAIQSVLSQSMSDWELIIIDDGSSDSSYSICKEFTDERIRLFHIENGGVSNARNMGIREAVGEYVTFLDSDDYIGPDYLYKLYQPEYEVIIGGLTMVDSEGNVIKHIFPDLIGCQPIEAVSKTIYQEQKCSGIYGFVSSKLISHKVIEEKGLLFDPDIKLAEDLNFFLDVYGYSDFLYFIDYAGYFYEQDTVNNAVSVSDDKIDFFQQMGIRKKLIDIVLKYNPKDTEQVYLYWDDMEGYIYTILQLSATNKYKKYQEKYERLRKEVQIAHYRRKNFRGFILLLYNHNFKLMIYFMLRIKHIINTGAIL